MATMLGEDIAINVRDPQTGAVFQLPVGAFKALCDAAGVLLLDEQNRCGHGTQNGLLCITQSRIVGDFKLHPDSRLIGAMNDDDGEGGDGARTRLTALADRQGDVHVRASFAGVFDYLGNRVGAEGSLERELATDYAYTADKARDLVSLEPAPGQVKRPSPRSIVKGVCTLAQALRAKRSDKLAQSALAAFIGSEAAGVYFAVRKIRQHLPSVEEIEKAPLSAKLPTDINVAVGALGLLGIAGKRNANSAWLYLGRWNGALVEISLAAGKTLLRGANAPTTPEACKVRDLMLAKAGLAGAGRATGLTW
jgi:hypothetical protein